MGNQKRHRTLTNAAGQCGFIHAHRDTLRRGLQAWEPLLAEWAANPALAAVGETTWALVMRTYRFLAPRFMTVQEWQRATTATPGKPPVRAVMTW